MNQPDALDLAGRLGAELNLTGVTAEAIAAEKARFAAEQGQETP